ncbi:uncharacterized protein DUF4233 [Actinomycetospora succinea]|uniref:Uncharacterized protein DUF4233 n=1 Tax=Actinomycetospora succinea TaxID=663603 RepID=A0A4R6V5D4_9PSEU|nr:DUF4233 domain-containing protein [Actinomycetospora succinea]TDQ54068.1 uncharacterized protein DUF4233 [Actinomycetospora succinea]
MTVPDGGAAAKKAFRGPASACLSLEAVIVPLGLLVMDKVEGGLTPAKIAWVVVLTVGMIVAIARFSKPWGLPLALALQVLMLLGWVVSPSLGILGLIFCLVWALMLWMRHEVLRRQRLFAERSGAGPG